MRLRDLTVCLALILLSTAVRADWPAMRHDARRSAVGEGTAQIDRPAIAFRHYLGGSLSNTQYYAHDVDGDGALEILLVIGGALVAKTPRDVLVWETPALDIFTIAGVVDLDGDGSPEVVCPARAGRMHVIDPRDGSVRWSMPAGVVGNVGAVRFAAFDTSAGVDLYVADAACGSTGSLGDIGRAYSFAGGIASPVVLFDLERGRRDYVCGQYDTIADVDGDGTLDVVAQGINHFYVYSTTDGHLIATSENVGSIPYGLAQVFLTQSDADAAPELVCFTENTYAPPTNSRRVFLMDWDTAMGTLVRRWEHSVADTLNDRHGWYPGGVQDLGDDGRIEVVTSFYDGASSSWTTRVYDVSDGTELAMLARGPFRGLADLDGDGTSEILVGDAASALGAYQLTGSGLTRVFLAPNIDPVYQRERDPLWPSAPVDRPLTVDLDDDGEDELIAMRQNADGSSTLLGLSASDDPPREVARLELEAGVSLLSFQPFQNVTRAMLQPIVARSDGYLWILDDELQPTNATIGGEIPERGMRTGGYYSGSNGIAAVPIAADRDGDGSDEVIVRDSRGVLLELDTRDASLVEPPLVRREIRRGYLPNAIDLTGDGRPEIVAGVLDTPHAIVAFRQDGTELWRTTVGSASRTLTGDLVTGDVSGDGVPDVVYQLSSSSGGTVIINALDGRNGADLWTTSYETVVAGSGLGVLALYDRDADSRLDVLATPRNLFAWLSAIDGTEVSTVAANYPAHGIFHDVDADGTPEILASGTVYSAGAYALDLTPRWSDPAMTLHTRVLGAVASCASGPRYVQGHFNSPRVTFWNAATGAVLGDIALLDGRVWEPPSSAPDRPGVVGNVTIAPDIAGDGRATALVPSSDGHLYAIDACTLALRWEIDLRYPVGEAILADPDGDGEQEILVTAADGFLYGIDREVLPAPAYVYENDGTFLATSDAEDVDEVVTTSRLWANWAPVTGATEYEYAVITPGGAFLTIPEFVNAGSATSVEVTGLPLRSGGRYLFAVRAIGPDGSSSEALSDGVVVLEDPCSACAVTQICVDGTCVADRCFGVECPLGTVCMMGECTGADDAGMSIDAGMTDAGPPTTMDGGCCSSAPRRGTDLGWLLLALALLGIRRRS
jgi:outer membrane protein assembly factor BamB